MAVSSQEAEQRLALDLREVQAAPNVRRTFPGFRVFQNGSVRDSSSFFGRRAPWSMRRCMLRIRRHTLLYSTNRQLPPVACEVLGGMLYLVFCLDLVHQWVQSRDDQIKAGIRSLQSFQISATAGDGAELA